MSKRNRLRFSELNEKINNIDLDQKVKSAILEVIDEKVESDMDKFITTLESFKNELKTENQSLRNEIKIVYWVIGIATAIIGMMIAFKK